MTTNIFLISDTHWGHTNLINYGVRPQFKNCEEHDETIINNWNSVVGKGDLVYHLGDVVWGCDYSIFQKLNGNKIVIKGNHDKEKFLAQAKNKNYIAGFYPYKEILVGKDYIWLAHFPHLSWNRSFHNSYHAFGHSHGSLKQSFGRSMDVSVDCINYTPIHVDDFINRLKDRDNTQFYNC